MTSNFIPHYITTDVDTPMVTFDVNRLCIKTPMNKENILSLFWIERIQKHHIQHSTKDLSLIA